MGVAGQMPPGAPELRRTEAGGCGLTRLLCTLLHSSHPRPRSALCTPMGSLRARLHRVHRSSATSGALLLLATLSVLWFEGTSGGGPLVSRLRAPPVAATAAAAAVVQGPPCSPSLVVLLTSHKTGTAQAGCGASLPGGHRFECSARCGSGKM